MKRFRARHPDAAYIAEWAAMIAFSLALGKVAAFVLRRALVTV